MFDSKFRYSLITNLVNMPVSHVIQNIAYRHATLISRQIFINNDILEQAPQLSARNQRHSLGNHITDPTQAAVIEQTEDKQIVVSKGRIAHLMVTCFPEVSANTRRETIHSQLRTNTIVGYY